MKKLLLGFIAVLTLALSFQACNEDIELSGDFEETAIVYALLDQADSIHWIKITRAFIGPGNALEFAQIPDSNYFNSVTGTVTEYENVNSQGEPINPTGRVFTLRDTLVDNKDPNGVFYAPEQKLYYFTNVDDNGLDQPLQYDPFSTGDDLYYTLDLDINEGEFQVTSTTEMVHGMSNQNILNSSQPYRFIGNQGEYIPTSVVISTTGNAHKINTTVHVSFTEWIGTTPTVVEFDWLLGETEVEPNSTKTYQAQGAIFYELIESHCSDDPNIDKRTMNSMTTIITGASEDLERYIQISTPASSLAQNKPTFTNLEATNDHKVYGLFSSRQTITIYKPFIDDSPIPNNSIRCINKKSTEHLCTSGVSFYFCSDHPLDNIVGNEESWSCP
ncbi:MAG: hypothetical protein QNK23_08990 [Crocinitomicaceae bacterium]|nr:hypothetical protein [Crocinitomicaceae bacterium]